MIYIYPLEKEITFFVEVTMKKLIGLLATGSICMFAACSSGEDDPITPPNSWNNGGSNTQVTAETCQQAGKVLSVDPVTSTLYCADPALSSPGMQTGFSSSSADPYGGTGITPQAGITPTTQASSSSLSIVPPAASSSSVASSPASSPATQTPKSSPGTQTPPADESDGKWHLALWDGTAGDPQVPTGNKTGGYWYSYTDSGDKGKSVLVWDATDDGTSADGLVPVITECQGLCGSFDLIVGANPYKPYVGVGFNYSKSANEVADATSSRGVCVTYTSTIDIILEMGLGSQDSKIGYANPFVTLPASASPKTVDFGWADFEQPDWASAAQTVTNPQQALASLKFKFAGTKDSTDGGSGSFKIMKVGAPSECN